MKFTILMGAGNGQVPEFTGTWEQVFDWLDGECAKVGARLLYRPIYRPTYDPGRTPDEYASGTIHTAQMAYPVHWRVRAA